MKSERMFPFNDDDLLMDAIANRNSEIRGEKHLCLMYKLLLRCLEQLLFLGLTP